MIIIIIDSFTEYFLNRFVSKMSENTEKFPWAQGGILKLLILADQQSRS